MFELTNRILLENGEPPISYEELSERYKDRVSNGINSSNSNLIISLLEEIKFIIDNENLDELSQIRLASLVLILRDSVMSY